MNSSATLFKVTKRQWEDLEVPSCPFEVQMHGEGQCVCSIAPLCQQYGNQTSDRTPRHHHYSLEHD